jgi:hypothetical protein
MRDERGDGREREGGERTEEIDMREGREIYRERKGREREEGKRGKRRT